MDTLQRIAADPEPDHQRADAHACPSHHQRPPDDAAEAPRLAEVAADHHPQAGIEEQDIGDRHVSSEAHTSEHTSLMRSSYADCCLPKKTHNFDLLAYTY